MRAIQIDKFGGPEVLQYRTDVPIPSIKEDEVRSLPITDSVTDPDIYIGAVWKVLKGLGGPRCKCKNVATPECRFTVVVGTEQNCFWHLKFWGVIISDGGYLILNVFKCKVQKVTTSHCYLLLVVVKKTKKFLH